MSDHLVPLPAGWGSGHDGSHDSHGLVWVDPDTGLPVEDDQGDEDAGEDAPAPAPAPQEFWSGEEDEFYG